MVRTRLESVWRSERADENGARARGSKETSERAGSIGGRAKIRERRADVEIDRGRERERAIHLGAPRRRGIGPSRTREPRDWSALFTSWYPGAFVDRRKRGGNRERERQAAPLL